MYDVIVEYPSSGEVLIPFQPSVITVLDVGVDDIPVGVIGAVLATTAPVFAADSAPSPIELNASTVAWRMVPLV